LTFSLKFDKLGKAVRHRLKKLISKGAIILYIMFPNDAKTIINFTIKSSDKIILTSTTSPRTILYAAIESYDPLYNNRITCGSDIPTNRIATAFGQVPRTADFMTKLCSDDIHLIDDGIVNNVWAKIVYVDYDLSTAQSQTPINSYNGFSYGDTIIIMIMLFIFTLLFFSTLKQWIFGTKVEGIVGVKIKSRL
jgi:hypothetical protein